MEGGGKKDRVCTYPYMFESVGGAGVKAQQMERKWTNMNPLKISRTHLFKAPCTVVLHYTILTKSSPPQFETLPLVQVDLLAVLGGSWVLQDCASFRVHHLGEILYFRIDLLLVCVLNNISRGVVSGIHRMQWVSCRMFSKESVQSLLGVVYHVGSSRDPIIFLHIPITQSGLLSFNVAQVWLLSPA